MVYYSDFRNNFTIHPIKKDLTLATDVQSINQSLKNLMFTDRYERYWHPLKGAGIPQTLFENMNNDTAFLLEQKILEVIAKYEPRCTKVRASVVTSNDNNSYVASIYYTPINSVNEITLEAIFKRVR